MRNFQAAGRSQTVAASGMVATSHPLAANQALDILKRGGNAMDAALCGATMLQVCEPHMNGIGGDLFALVSPAGTDDVFGFNGSGFAPEALRASDLRDQGLTSMPIYSAHAVTLPGFTDGLVQLSGAYGRLELADILAPVISYAEAGVPVSPRAAFDWKRDHQNLDKAARRHFLIDGLPLQIGDKFRAPGLADIYRRIVKDGPSAFYEGEVAEDILAALNAAGGVHSVDDFASVSGYETTPIGSTYQGLEILEHPPNGQGATALLMLNILKHFDLGGLDPLGAQRVHLEAEATRLAYNLRNKKIADPKHADPAPFVAEETAAVLASQIDMSRAGDWGPPPKASAHKDTVYITVVDKDRMAVSLISSIFHSFGSGIASEKFGVLLQNRGAGFVLDADHPNEAGPGKRPLHTIIPGFARRDGIKHMPFGVMGGQYQSTGHARLISNILDFDMDVQAAIDLPRAFAEIGTLKLEEGYSDATKRALTDLGHNVSVTDRPLGGGQAIQIDHERGVLIGGSDPRKDGCAIGY